MKRSNPIAIAVAVALVYFSTFQPSDWVRDGFISLFGPRPYEGVWIFIPHLLFYCTMTALLAALCWLVLARREAMPRPGFGVSKPVVGWALAGGVASVIASVAFLSIMGMGELKWVGFDGWKIAGNLFSNLYEEFIYRGFLLTALTSLFGFWPAAVLSSLAFGFGHEQYPWTLQIFIAGVSVGWCWLVRRTRSIWAAWGAHMIVDTVVDAIWG